MSEITTVGLDLAKQVVSLCGEDACGRVVVQLSLIGVMEPGMIGILEPVSEG